MQVLAARWKPALSYIILSRRRQQVKGSLNTETRERIGGAVRKLGYLAYGAARALASPRTSAVIPWLGYAIFASTADASELSRWTLHAHRRVQ